MPESKEICTIVPLDQDGFQPLVYGMGFLVNDYDILTCAHVIEAALGADWQSGSGKVRVCFPFSETEGKFLVLDGEVDRERWFAKGQPTVTRPTDIAVIRLRGPAPTSVKRGTLIDSDFDGGINVKVYGFPGLAREDGSVISHPAGLHVEGKVVDSLPGGRGQFEGVRTTGARVQKGYSGASVYDPVRDSIVGMIVRADIDETTKIAEFIGAPSLRLALGTAASAAGAESIQQRRSIPAALRDQTNRKKQEIEVYLREISMVLPVPDGDGDLAELIDNILFSSPEAARLRAAFGFDGEMADLHTVFRLMQTRNHAVQMLWGKWAQRIDQALWRYGYTLDYVEADWTETVLQRVRELRTVCEPYRPAKQPTLKDIAAILSQGSHDMTHFIEYTPDGELYAVMRSFRSPAPKDGKREDFIGKPEPESGPAMQFLLDYLNDVKAGKRSIDDSSNAWWAVRIGICRCDERFQEPLAFVVEKFGDPHVPQEQAINNPMPEIYRPVSTVSYTLSNAQAILECGRRCNLNVPAGVTDRLHEVIAKMRERLLATPVSKNLYLASVHQEGLRNYLDYLKDQHVTISM